MMAGNFVFMKKLIYRVNDKLKRRKQCLGLNLRRK